MNPAAITAMRIRRHHKLRAIVSEGALDDILKAEGLRVMPAPCDFPLREFLRGRVIGIRADQPQSWRLWVKAHALGHYLLHRGCQFENCDEVAMAKQERQADLFAGYLLLANCWQGEAPWELAEKCGVPLECVQRWLEMAKVSTCGNMYL